MERMICQRISAINRKLFNTPTLHIGQKSYKYCDSCNVNIVSCSKLGCTYRIWQEYLRTDMEKYGLKVQTSNRYLTAGTKSCVFVKLVGHNGNCTNWHKLGTFYFFTDSFKPGSLNEFAVYHDGDIVGPPIILKLKLAGLGLDPWLCDDIVVQYNDQTYEFPVFDWVESNEISVTTGEATLPQHITLDVVRTLRKMEVGENKTRFQWLPNPTEKDMAWELNRYMNASTFLGLPRLFRRTYGRLKSLGVSGISVAYNVGRNWIKAFFTSISTFDDYKQLYRHIGYKDPFFINSNCRKTSLKKRFSIRFKPKFLEVCIVKSYTVILVSLMVGSFLAMSLCWELDEEMGRQVLTGISPLAFKRCTEIPEYCSINEEMLRGIIPKEQSLSKLMETGKLYIADYTTYTNGVKRNIDQNTGEPFVCANCVGFFLVTDDDKFVPIAIQLVPKDPEYLFTPKDTKYDWLLAKMYFRSTMQNVHEWVYHFYLTHGMSETFAIATLRCFPRNHPLYKLLRPHLYTAPSINTDARFAIFPEGSLANKSLQLSGISTLRKYYKSFHISQLDIPAVLKRNGTDDPKLLPNYHYRDDALDIWTAMEKFVRKTIKFYYPSNEEIKGDFELQEWAKDVAHEGFGWQDGDTRGVPDHIESVEQLVQLCTSLIFTSSAQHAAVNFGQMETYQFVPNSPGAMRLPIHRRREGSLERIMKTLPSVMSASLSISFSYSLSEYTEDEIFLGEFPEKLFTEERIIEAQEEFHTDLQELALKFHKRNERLQYPYTYLLPERIPNSIAI